ncbi:glutathione S-transferase N-terminal domain-containing protein [Salinimonas marina]|uniref:Glutathione S-transferase N-terminal domain-containing protein n=1 Tax=Salinimonas marina TaxID=2785918 RepID=A0A7S9HE57_9ALTE|nr:glutaredoxin domain-containing protein [Salinimonas marina]QPG06966.1 glutathione S-transferase N-terminal domain-containing protein [Salinimonas marina]
MGREDRPYPGNVLHMPYSPEPSTQANPMLTIYGSKGCTFCVKAVELLTEKELPFDYYDIKVPEQKDKLDFIKNQGLRTIPQVYQGDTHIGGYQELVRYLNHADS